VGAEGSPSCKGKGKKMNFFTVNMKKLKKLQKAKELSHDKYKMK
jgi:hypothetical protein